MAGVCGAHHDLIGVADGAYSAMNDDDNEMVLVCSRFVLWGLSDGPSRSWTSGTLATSYLLLLKRNRVFPEVAAPSILDLHKELWGAAKMWR